MPEKTLWEAFFDVHAPAYDDNVFTKNTEVEVGFLLDVLQPGPGAEILDVGCGTGRHTVALAGRGYRVTGIDLSSSMLSRAREAARAAGVEVNWVCGDATRFSIPGRFDAALCLCEGAFGLLGREDDPIGQPLSILSNICLSLKPGGKVLFTVLNGAAMIRRYQNADVAEGRFDPITLVASGVYPPLEGLPPLPVRERAFVPTELVLLFRVAGLTVSHIWGGTAGNWGKRPLDLDEMEIMVVASRTSEPCTRCTAGAPL